MPTIRAATLEDAVSIATLMTAFNADYSGVSAGARPRPADAVSAEQAANRMQAMAASEQVFIAEGEDGEAMGLLSVRILPYLSDDAPYGEITELYVSRAYRRQRIAMLLLAEAERIARDRGVKEISIGTDVTNTAAQAFYKAMGYAALEVGFQKRLPPKRSAKSRRAEG